MQRSIFYGNLALEHPDFSSSPYSISLLNEGSIEQFLQGDLIHVKLSFVKKLAFVLLVDLTNDMALFERSFLLIIFFSLEITLESIVSPYREENRSLLEVKISYMLFILINLFLNWVF
jgi:hypothetical protein